MNIKDFDPIIRGAAAVSRRGSFRAMGGAVLVSALAGTAAAAAGKAGKSRRNGKKRQNRCRQLGEHCRRGVVEICQSWTDPLACQELHAPCCEHFARCRVSASAGCVMEND